MLYARDAATKPAISLGRRFRYFRRYPSDPVTKTPANALLRDATRLSQTVCAELCP